MEQILNPEEHKELIAKLAGLVDFLQRNGFGYWLSVGKDGQGANYCGGKVHDVVDVVSDLASRNEQVAKLLQDALNESLF